MERWLRTSGIFEKALRPLWKFEGKFDDANKMADEVWKRLMAKLPIDAYIFNRKSSIAIIRERWIHKTI